MQCIMILQICDVSPKLLVIGASEVKSHVFIGFAVFWYLRRLSKSVTVNGQETSTVIILLPIIASSPSCQCARLFHELASTHKQLLNLRTTIS